MDYLIMDSERSKIEKQTNKQMKRQKREETFMVI